MMKRTNEQLDIKGYDGRFREWLYRMQCIFCGDETLAASQAPARPLPSRRVGRCTSKRCLSPDQCTGWPAETLNQQTNVESKADLLIQKTPSLHAMHMSPKKNPYSHIMGIFLYGTACRYTTIHVCRCQSGRSQVQINIEHCTRLPCDLCLVQINQSLN